jgi:hypothetical protein
VKISRTVGQLRGREASSHDCKTISLQLVHYEGYAILLDLEPQDI